MEQSRTRTNFLRSLAALLLIVAGVTATAIAATALPMKGQPLNLPWVLFFGLLAMGLAYSALKLQRGPSAMLPTIEALILLHVFVIFGVIVFRPVMLGAKAASRQTHCMSNAKQLVTGLHIYSSDYDGYLPPPDRWAKAADRSHPAAKCGYSDAPFTYALNKNLVGRNLNEVPDPENTIAIFDTESTEPNPVGGPADVVTLHGDFFIVGFWDGQAKAVKRGDGVWTALQVRWLRDTSTAERRYEPTTALKSSVIVTRR